MEADAVAVAVNVTASAISKVVVEPLIQQIQDLINLSKNRRRVQSKLEILQNRLSAVKNAFQDQLKTPEEPIIRSLERTKVVIKDARKFTDGSQRCTLNCLFATEMREWIKTVDELEKDLRDAILDFVAVKKMVKYSPQQTIFHPPPSAGYVGSRITDAEQQLRTWIDEEHRVIAVYGIAGVGKTTLLQKVYNYYSERKNSGVQNAFHFLIWVEISEHSVIRDLQCHIAEAIDLDLSSTSQEHDRKRKLSERLSKKKFLLILDNMCKLMDLRDIGVEFGPGSKVVFSSTVKGLMPVQKSIELKPLSSDQGWEMFEKIAFKEGDFPEDFPEDLKERARKFAEKCQGLPLAIAVVASAMASNRDPRYWNDESLSLMESADGSFQRIHPETRELYRRLKYCYNILPDTFLQKCFLYCAMYPRNPKIDVDILVRMWIAEGFVHTREGSYLEERHIGHSNVRLLIQRFLFRDDKAEKLGVGKVEKPDNVWKPKYISVYDAVREMSIYVAEGEENYFSAAGLPLQNFSQSQISGCERLSLSRSRIEYLPKDFKCPKLVSLILSENPLIYDEHLETFLTNLTCLRVLDLSHTSIQSVPNSLAELTQLRFLSLKNTQITSLPETIGDLSGLQFLDLSSCEKLGSLQSTMKKLTHLQYLNLSGMPRDLITTLEISQLTALKRLELYTENPKALQGLTNLIELNVTIILKAGADEMALSVGAWLEVRHLSWRYMDPVANRDLPMEMERMKSLETLLCDNLRLKILPKFFCEFEQLERLEFIGCSQLTKLCPLEKLPKLKYLKLKECTELKDLEIGSSGELNGFPMLKRLDLIKMSNLQSLAIPTISGGVLMQGTLSKLLVLKVVECLKLKRLPSGIENLSRLERIIGEDSWWEKILWPNGNMKMQLEKLFRKYKST